MITLVTTDTGWVKGPEEDPLDQCAHGRVDFQVNGTVFVRPEDRRMTISAAGLFLLRTLDHDHAGESVVAEGNFLFPCCAHTVFPGGKKFKVLCSGCCNGVQLGIVHKDGMIMIIDMRGNTETVTEAEWREAVLAFADQVEGVYGRYSARVIPSDPEEREGWKIFWGEWHSRVQAARKE